MEQLTGPRGPTRAWHLGPENMPTRQTDEPSETCDCSDSGLDPQEAKDISYLQWASQGLQAKQQQEAEAAPVHDS